MPILQYETAVAARSETGLDVHLRLTAPEVKTYFATFEVLGPDGATSIATLDYLGVITTSVPLPFVRPGVLNDVEVNLTVAVPDGDVRLRVYVNGVEDHLINVDSPEPLTR